MGWSLSTGSDNDDRTVITETNVTLTEDTNYYPVYKSAHWIHFNANPEGQTGASYTAPRFVLLGQTAASAKPADPTWKGHVFRYWSETEPTYDANGNLTNSPAEFDFNQNLDDREGDVELFAVWENGQTTYTVIFWKQKVTDDKNADNSAKTYDYAGQETETATSGSTVTAESFENHYTGFTVNATKSDDSVTVKADGSSVINVYFDRKLMTMRFYKNGNSTTDPGYTSQYWTNGSNRVTTYTGLYGQTLAQNGYTWPGTSVWNYYTNNGTGTMSYLGEFVFGAANNIEVRDPNEQEFRAYQADTSGDQTIHYYLEKPNGSYVEDSSGILDENAIAAIFGGGGNFTFSEKYDGYNVAQYRKYEHGQNPSGEWVSTHSGDSTNLTSGILFWTRYYDLDIRYNLKNYNIKFLDSTDNTELTNVTFTNTGANPVSGGVGNVKYTASLSNYQPPSDITPVSQYPGKEWDGKWYADQACTVEFDWSQTMPNADVAVYAGWRNIHYSVDIDPNGGELSSTESTYFWNNYGETIQEYQDITKNFIEDPDGTYYYLYNSRGDKTYDERDPSASRIAHYSTDSSETIDGVTVASDGTKYSFKQDAYSLVGWYRVNADGSLGEPYDFSTQITENIRIRAVWRMVGEFRVVYDIDAVDESGNALYKKDESGEITTDRVQATSVPSDSNSYADKSETAMLGKAGDPEGYVFQGWYYNGRVYNPGDVFQILAELADENDKVHVKPVYVPYDQAPIRNTHIYWYTNTKDIAGNTITTALTKTVTTKNDEHLGQWGEYYAMDDLQLNADVEILSASAYAYEGYEFIGWAKSENATTPWLAYDSSTGKFKENGTEVRYVAADEQIPYDDLFALWKVKTYTVTINKIVDGNTEDNNVQFTFSSQPLQSANYGLKHGESKTFTEVPYGTVFTLSEETGGNAAAFSPTVSAVLTKDDGNTETSEPANGAEYTVTGDWEITYTNTRNRQNIVFQKTDKTSGDILADATFTMSGEKGTSYTLTSVAVTEENPNGYFVANTDGTPVRALPTDTYTITETAAPAGYYPAGTITLNVTKNGVSYQQSDDNANEPQTITPDDAGNYVVIITNTAGVELPMTGGIGTHIYTLSGLTLTAGALMYGFRMRRRERRNE